MTRTSPEVLGSNWGPEAVLSLVQGIQPLLQLCGEDVSSSDAAGKVSIVHPFKFLQLQVNSVGL
jgi:hypothetical protein